MLNGESKVRRMESGGPAVLDRMVMEGFTEEVTFGQRFKGGDRTSQAVI